MRSARRSANSDATSVCRLLELQEVFIRVQEVSVRLTLADARFVVQPGLLPSHARHMLRATYLISGAIQRPMCRERGGGGGIPEGDAFGVVSGCCTSMSGRYRYWYEHALFALCTGVDELSLEKG